MATGQYTGAPTVGHRTRAVAAIRLRRRPDRGGAQGRASGGVVGVVPIPGRGSAAGSDRTQCLRGTGPDLPHPGRRTDLPAPRLCGAPHNRTSVPDRVMWRIAVNLQWRFTGEVRSRT